MKKAVMVATLCTMFFSVLAQDLNYREWVFTDMWVDSVAIFKSDTDISEIKDWVKYFNSQTEVTLRRMECKPYNDGAFFDIDEEGVYCIVGRMLGANITTTHTYIVVDKEYIRVMKEQGWAKEIDGKLSSKPYPLRFGRDSDCHVSAKSMLKQSEL